MAIETEQEEERVEPITRKQFNRLFSIPVAGSEVSQSLDDEYNHAPKEIILVDGRELKRRYVPSLEHEADIIWVGDPKIIPIIRATIAAVYFEARHPVPHFPRPIQKAA